LGKIPGLRHGPVRLGESRAIVGLSRPSVSRDLNGSGKPGRCGGSCRAMSIHRRHRGATGLRGTRNVNPAWCHLLSRIS